MVVFIHWKQTDLKKAQDFNKEMMGMCVYYEYQVLVQILDVGAHYEVPALLCLDL